MMTFSRLVLLPLLLCATCCVSFPPPAAAEEPAEEPAVIRLTARDRSQSDPASGQPLVRRRPLEWKADETAIVVCDMWDSHWCRGATRRVAEMAPRMNEVIAAARERGVLIVHAPSSCMKFYEGTPMRELARRAPPVKTEIALRPWCHLDPAREEALPIDDSDGGCDCRPRCASGSPWTRQIAAIEIREGDAVTDSAEAYYLMRQRGIKNVIVMGVHTNMCVLGRPFSIRQMVYQGQNVVLMRDMTDSMYNPRSAPRVSHFRGTELVIEHIERHWCPTVTSADFTGKAGFRFREDDRPRVETVADQDDTPPTIVLVIGEQEYRTKETLPEFARQSLEPLGYRCRFVHADEEDGNRFPGLEALDEADLLILSVRRRTLPEQQLERIRRYLRRGKPLIGIRTASHAFALRDGDPPAGHAAWPEFDGDVLGGHYTGHHGNRAKTSAWVPEDARDHPIARGLPAAEFPTGGSLYKTRPLADSTRTLLMGRIDADAPPEPVAWTNRQRGGKVFYTSLGHPDDFRSPEFRAMLVNAVRWTLEKD